MSTYVSKSSLGIYKVRIRVTKTLQPFFHQKEIIKSLSTTNYEEALNKARSIIMGYKQLLQLKENSMISAQQLQSLVNKYILDSLEQDRQDRALMGYGTVYVPSDGTLNPTLDFLSSHISDMREQLANSDFLDIRDEAIRLLNTLSITFNDSEPSHRLLMQSLLRARIEVFEEAYNRYCGRFNPQYDARVEIQPTIVTQSSSTTSKTTKEAMNLFLRKYQAETSETQYKDVSNFFSEIYIHLIREETPLVTTTLEDLLEIREILEAFPRRNIQRFRDMSIQELIDSYPEESECISVTTLNKYIKWIKMFYAFCYENENSFIARNPSISLPIKSSSNALTERLPLNVDEIKNLLEMTALEPALQNGIKVLAYSGMRLSEMYKASIKINSEGVRYFDLTEPSLQLKTKCSYRIIPIHEDIDISLLSELPTQDSFSKKVNALIREYISNDERKVLYSLRHSFATELKNKMVIHEVISELMGHSHGTMTFGRYASAYSIEILKEAIDKLSFN